MSQSLPHDHGHLPPHLAEEMPTPATFDTVAELLKLLSDGSRLQLFWLLCHCEECVINLAALLGLSSPAVSHHLKLLKTAGLVVSRREGKEVYYTAADTPRTAILHSMVEAVVERACPVEQPPVDAADYDSAVATVGAVHAFLTADLTRRPTIDELARRFHLNQTTLKTTFKAVWGRPIAAYMKAYRIQRAVELLTHTDRSLADIAREVGYESQSKFTEAFKGVTGRLPKDVRKSR